MAKQPGWLLLGFCTYLPSCISMQHKVELPAQAWGTPVQDRACCGFNLSMSWDSYLWNLEENWEIIRHSTHKNYCRKPLTFYSDSPKKFESLESNNKTSSNRKKLIMSHCFLGSKGRCNSSFLLLTDKPIPNPFASSISIWNRGTCFNSVMFLEPWLLTQADLCRWEGWLPPLTPKNMRQFAFHGVLTNCVLQTCFLIWKSLTVGFIIEFSVSIWLVYKSSYCSYHSRRFPSMPFQPF